MLTRLATHNPGEYDGWAFADLSTTLAAHGIHPVKSHGVMVVRADDITAARAARAPSGQDAECGDSARAKLPALASANPARGGKQEPREKQRKPPEMRSGTTGTRLPPESNATRGRDDPRSRPVTTETTRHNHNRTT